MADAIKHSGELVELANKNAMTTEEALALCDALPAVDLETIMGRWRGSGVSTGHEMDGLLEMFHWYGKDFIDRDHVHPLLFTDEAGHIFSLDPRRLPLNLALKVPALRTPLIRKLLLASRFLLQTHKAKARVRMLEYRGKVSATMIYDNLPIYDTFRLIDHDTLLGVMDFKGMQRPFIFKLQRDR